MGNSRNQMDIRYQVFISSTFRELGEKRKDAIKAVVDAGHIPIALERFGASRKKDLEVIEKTMKESQIYIVILGHLYGSRIKGKPKSYTEFEYDLAKKNGLIILPFVMNENHIKSKRSELNRDNEDDNKELKNEDLLGKFLKKVRDEHFYKSWCDDTDIELEVSKSLTQLFNDKEESLKIPPGFIKSVTPLDNVIIDAVSTNEFVREAVIAISNFKSLDSRINDEFVSKKKASARFFWQTYGNHIVDNKIDLFLESGSTTAYAANEMKNELKEHVHIQEDGSLSIDIKTNNALVFLQFWLSARIPCSMFPWGSPEGNFGASFGPIWKLIKRDPSYPPAKLTEKENNAIKQLQEAAFGLKIDGNKQRLLILAISALQLSTDPLFDKPIPQDSSSNCIGLHVGSYYNKIFKLFLYTTDLPSIICLHEDKIDSQIKVGHCHFLFESPDDWNRFLQEKPLAFSVGCNIANLDTLSARFEKIGFIIDKCNNMQNTTAFIAKNQLFVDKFEKLQMEP